jgi:hypothetical protein
MPTPAHTMHADECVRISPAFPPSSVPRRRRPEAGQPARAAAARRRRSPAVDRRSARTRTPPRVPRPACGPPSAGPRSLGVARAAREHEVRAEGGAHDARERRDAVGRADERDLRVGARWKSIACRKWPNAPGWRGAISCRSRRCDTAWSS